MTNPFAPRPEPRKHHAGLSMTGDQYDAFVDLKARLDLPSDSAVLKAGLNLLWTSVQPDRSER